LDAEEGVLYFWPLDGSLKLTDQVVAPALSTLVDINGASWLVISGITFTETLGGDDLHRAGLDGYGAMYPIQGWKYCGEALHLKNAEHCVIENNRFYAVGGNAIYLERYNARNIIRRNEISYAGANGVSLLGNYVPTDSVSQPIRDGREPLPMFNEVTDNYIHHCGVQNKYIAGVFLGVSDSNLIAHNRFEYLPHHAINLSLNGYGRNVLEYNEIHHVCLELRDNGAINAWMDDPQSDVRAGHIIRFNLMTDVQGCGTKPEGSILTPDGMANGIYLDNDTSNCLIQGNIIVRASGYGVFVHGGQHNAIENNIIIDATTTASDRSVIGCGQVGYAGYLQSSFLMGNRFCNNIVSYQKGKYDGPMALFCFHPWSDNRQTEGEVSRVISESRGNVFFRRDTGDYFITETAPQDGKVAVRKTLTLPDWQKLGFDADSETADPLFVDPARDDYRLKAESPAVRLGFVPIDIARIGVRQQS
jgi:parallel beta-helix repeat protein